MEGHLQPLHGWRRVCPPVALAAWLALVCCSVFAQEEAKRAEGEDHVRRLTDEASELFQAGKYADARDRAKAAVAVAEEALGPDDPLLVSSLSWLGGAQQELGDLKGARSSHERALAISEKIHGLNDIETARCVNNLARAVREAGDLKGARPLYERSLAIREKVLGPDDPSLAKALSNLATLLEQLGELAAARSLLERAVSIQVKSVGPDDLATAISLGNLAMVLRGMGDLLGAKPLCERVIAIHEKQLGPSHPETATSVSSLAVVLYELGDLSAARGLHERSLALWQKALGPNHPSVALALSNLAFVAKAEGDLDTARTLFERALEIQEEVLGANHPQTAEGLNHLASIFIELGDGRSAMRLHQRALAIHEKVYGPDHPRLALDLTHLAGDLEAMGEQDRAEALYERALEIQEAKLGSDHPIVAWTHFDLGYLLRTRGKLEKAREHCERALEIREKRLGPDHRDVAAALSELAALRGAAGDAKGRKELLARALAIREKAYGPDHPATTAARTNVAMAMWDLGEREAAEPMLTRAWSEGLAFLGTLLPALSSRDRQSLLRAQAGQLGCHLRAFAMDPTRSWAAALAWKGAALRAGAMTLRIPPAATEEEARFAEELYQARRALAAFALSPRPSAAGAPSAADRFHTLRGRVEELERALGKRHRALASGSLAEVGTSDVQQSIPEGVVLLDLLENEGWVHAWVARREGEVKHFTLGRASDLDPLVRRFREALENDDSDAWRDAGGDLRKALGGALESATDCAGVLCVSPDGGLATIPWGLLPEGEGFLIERLPVVCTNGGAALVLAAQSRREEAVQGLLALGDVDYSGLDRPFPVLSLTQGEVRQLEKRFQAKFAEAPCRTALGMDASEATFREAAPKARYVHVATHGFFDIDNLRVAVASGTRGLSGKSAAPLEVARQEGLDVGGWNPLLLSGLVLAPSKEGDGYLTAEELQDLDLRGVELVVLSACETGRGELAAGEGVLGLARALAIAGARQFMLSLWKVPDAETSELMDAFYAGLWDGSLPAEEALRHAQLAMLTRDRARGVFRPSTWGAWVLTR